MSDSLDSLESRRSEILREFSTLGDLRPGSVTTTGGRCGNRRCHCHQPGDPGHGPYYRLTRKVNGRTVTESLGSAALRRKVEREVAEFHRFQALVRDFVEVNEQICRLRPVEEE